MFSKKEELTSCLLMIAAVTVEHSRHIDEKPSVSFGLKSDSGEKLSIPASNPCVAGMITAGVDKVHSLPSQNEHCFIIR